MKSVQAESISLYLAHFHFISAHVEGPLCVAPRRLDLYESLISFVIKRKDIEPKTISPALQQHAQRPRKIWASLLVKAGLLPFQNSHLAGESKFAIRSLNCTKSSCLGDRGCVHTESSISIAGTLPSSNDQARSTGSSVRA